MKLSKRTLATLLICALLPASQAVVFGETVTGATSNIAGVLSTPATVHLAYVDNNPTDGALGSSEAIILTFFADAVIHSGDILISNPAGSGITGTAGSVFTADPGGVVAYTTGAVDLDTLVFSIDSMPSWANGGPDTKVNPGEPLFIDADNNGILGAGDRVLAAGAGMTGAFGATVSTAQNEAVWDPVNECIFASADALSDAGDTHVTADTAGCPGALGKALVTLSGVRATAITKVVADAATTLASTTVTSPGGSFAAGDVGFTISGTGIPAGATITVFTDANTVTISAAATATGGPISATVGTATVLEPGEDAYLSADATVGTGDVRLTDVGALTAGSIVQCGVFGADADCAGALASAALTNTKVTTASQNWMGAPLPFKSFDNNGNNIRDVADAVVLDVDGDDFISTADVRINNKEQTAGARPSIVDKDTGAFLEAGALTVSILWLDDGDNQVETTEPLIAHIGAGTTFAMGDICLTTVGGCAAGAQRDAGDAAPTVGGTWKLISAATNAGELTYHDADNNGKFTRGDSLYVHFGAVPGTLAPGDLLIGGDVGATGTKVTSGSLSLKALPGGFAFRYLDVDGSGTWSIGDALYLDRATGTVNRGEAGDVRMNSLTGLTGWGRTLAMADKDTVWVLNSAGEDPASPYATRELDSFPGFSLGDPLFLQAGAVGCPLAGSDLVLMPGQLNVAPGTFVGGGQTACTVLGGTPMFGFAPVGVYSITSEVYWEFAPDNVVSAGDGRISGNAFGGAGSRVTSQGDVNTALTTLDIGATLGTRAVAVDLGFLDVSGDALLAGGDDFVLDIDGNLLLTPGDVFLSGTGGTTSGGGGGGGTSTPAPTTNPTSSSSSTSTAPSSTSSASSSTTVPTSSSTSSTSSASSSASSSEGLKTPPMGIVAMIGALAAITIIRRK